MTTTTTLTAARKVPNFETFAVVATETPALSRLGNKAQTLRLHRRQPLTFMPDTVLILRSGVVAAEHGALGTDRTMAELHYPGDIISSPAASLVSTVTYSSLVPTSIWRLSTNAFHSSMAGDVDLTSYVLQRLDLQRARLQLHISMLAALTSEQRVAALLLQAASHLGTANGRAVSFELPLSRMEVADYLALNADTLSRIMSRLIREGVLARSSRAQITIRDMDALKMHCPLSDAITALHGTALQGHA